MDTEQNLLSQLADAEAAGKISSAAAERVRLWLTDTAYLPQRHIVVEHIEQGRFAELDNAFWTVLQFGTGGRRGRVYPIGTNTINARTIGESAQGVANYLRSVYGTAARLSGVVAHDTRVSSREFAEITASVLAGNGFQVYFFPEHRSTPQLSFAVRHLNCTTGVMISASHNPPSDNGFKCYWSNGGQVLPPHDDAIIEYVKAVREVRSILFSDSLRNGRIALLRDDHDLAYIDAVAAQARGTARRLRVVFTPLHGVGLTNVARVLERAGFGDLHTVASQATPDGRFPNVDRNTPNPEQPATLRQAIDLAKQVDAQLVLASDPDADRIGGAAVRAPGEWAPFTGNQIAALLTSYVCRKQSHPASGRYVVKTLVTTELVRRIAESNGVATKTDLPVGFKWIAEEMDARGTDGFLLGTEESHGYLTGGYARDKDGAVAALLLAELAAELHVAGRTLWDHLDELYVRHGYHVESQVNRTLEGREGALQINRLMASLRNSPPRELGGMRTTVLRDYAARQLRRLDDSTVAPFFGPQCEMLAVDLEQSGWFVVARPSGTEPKVKFYLFGYADPTRCQTAAELAKLKESSAILISRITHDLDRFIAQVVSND